MREKEDISCAPFAVSVLGVHWRILKKSTK
jgi:hypothetical protein